MKHCHRFYTGVCMGYCKSIRYIVVGASNSNCAPSSSYIFFFHGQNCHSSTTSASDLAAGPATVGVDMQLSATRFWTLAALFAPIQSQERQCYQPLLPADVPSQRCPVGLNLFHTKLGKPFLYRHDFVHRGIIIMLEQERAFPKLLPQHC